jgi:hypothetical protein
MTTTTTQMSYDQRAAQVNHITISGCIMEKFQLKLARNGSKYYQSRLLIQARLSVGDSIPYINLKLWVNPRTPLALIDKVRLLTDSTNVVVEGRLNLYSAYGKVGVSIDIESID